MELLHYMISIVLFCTCVVGMISSAESMGDTYGVSLSDGLEDSYDNVDDVQDISESMFTAVDGGEVNEESSDYGIMKGSVGAVKTTFRTYPIVKSLAETIQKRLGISPIFFKAFTIICLLVLTWGVIFMIFRFR